MPDYGYFQGYTWISVSSMLDEPRNLAAVSNPANTPEKSRECAKIDLLGLADQMNENIW